MPNVAPPPPRTYNAEEAKLVGSSNTDALQSSTYRPEEIRTRAFANCLECSIGGYDIHLK